MTLTSKVAFSYAASAVLIATAALAQPVAEGGRKFTTTLSGAQECSNATPPVCGIGDPDGTGTATVTLNPGQNRVCWEITVSNVAAPTRGHIHNAPAGTNGGIVVDFFNSTPAPLTGCVDDERATIIDIIQNPQNYYVNIHNADFPGGAIRGQLSKK